MANAGARPRCVRLQRALFCRMRWSSKPSPCLLSSSAWTSTPTASSSPPSVVYLVRASDPLSIMTLVWEGESQVHCIVEHHHGRLYLFIDAAREGVHVNSHYLMQCDVEFPGPKSWKSVFLEETVIILEDVDFCCTHMVLILRQGRKFRLCSVNLPLQLKKICLYLKISKGKKVYGVHTNLRNSNVTHGHAGM